MKNKILAIPAAPAAIPPNPNTAAIIANTTKVTVQRNIYKVFRFPSDYLLISTIQISDFIKAFLAVKDCYLDAFDLKLIQNED